MTCGQTIFRYETCWQIYIVASWWTGTIEIPQTEERGYFADRCRCYIRRLTHQVPIAAIFIIVYTTPSVIKNE